MSVSAMRNLGYSAKHKLNQSQGSNPGVSRILSHYETASGFCLRLRINRPVAPAVRLRKSRQSPKTPKTLSKPLWYDLHGKVMKTAHGTLAATTSNTNQFKYITRKSTNCPFLVLDPLL